ncbi:MAG TPA: alpha/beta hydrolase [Candidatus Limnocylindrales bacterium]|nr:alpha/beta hydrolase [Candidatus Limnocylindrales bacterium]
MSLETREHDVLVTATASDLPTAVAAALRHQRMADAPPGERGTVTAAGHDWATLTWGDPYRSPLLFVHGVTSEAAIFWRLAPAVAAAGWRVVAVDLPGHGGTGQWRARHRFAETALDLAAFIRTAALDVPELAVLGHSWGGMIVAALPAAGIRPRSLILLDPPHLGLDALELMTKDPSEQRYASIADAHARVHAMNPSWSDGDVEAKARGLTRFDVDGVLAVLLENGPWDAGLRSLDVPAAAGIPVWYIRGELHAGGLIPEAALPELAARAGADHVLTIAGGPHSPMRTHPEATTLAVLRALAG